MPPSASRRQMLYVAAAAGACLQWLVVRAAGVHPPHPWTAVLPGLCIFGAAFLLTWAAEAAEMDLPQSLSIGLVALIAVLPEYAVDMYFAWQAGKNPAYTQYAAANMTGANRLLIGVGWPVVLLAAWYSRGHREIRLTEKNAVEIVILLFATLYSFAIPLKGTLSLLDTAILGSLFLWYAYLSSMAPHEEPELEGPALTLARMPAARRRLAIVALFLFSAGAICLSAEPFAEGILAVGRSRGWNEFLMVQWLAPLASEAPEFIVAILFALKGKAGVGLRALVSSKVNQWTLLIGMLPLAYALSAGSPAPMRLDARQLEEIFLTSAQSLFALSVLMNLSFTWREAATLCGLFLIQVLFPDPHTRYFFAGGYLCLSFGVLFLFGPARRLEAGNLIRQVLRLGRR